MDYMDQFIYGVGCLVLGVIGLFILWFLFELIIVGGIASFSHHRWMMKSYRALHPEESMWAFYKKWWPHLLKSYFEHMWELMGHRNAGALTYRSKGGGYWRGVGDWKASVLCTALPTKIKDANGNWVELSDGEEEDTD